MPDSDLLAARLADVRALLAARDDLAGSVNAAPFSVADLEVVAGLNAAQDEAAGCVPRLLAAVDAVLNLHAPRSDRVLGSACGKHRLLVPTLLPLPDCEECVQDRRREVCPECRDQYGDPVLFDLCRVRSAVLAALTGEGKSGD